MPGKRGGVLGARHDAVQMYREAAKQVPNMVFCGTHETCRYMDMAETVAAALALAEKQVKTLKK